MESGHTMQTFQKTGRTKKLMRNQLNFETKTKKRLPLKMFVRQWTSVTTLKMAMNATDTLEEAEDNMQSRCCALALRT